MTASYTYQDQLETNRLVTRFLTLEDVAAWSLFFKDKEAIAFFSTFGLASNRDQAKQWIERQLARYQEKKFGLQALIHKETKAFVGQCGLVKQEVNGVGEVEVGYHLFHNHWGHGYATEAAARFIGYAFENNLADSVISIIDIRNIRSQRVADRNGLTREKQIRWSGVDVYVYRVYKETWK